MSSDAEILFALEKAGVELSRNRNFALFEEPANRRALFLKRRLQTVARALRHYAPKGQLRLGLRPDEGRFAVEVSIPHLSATCVLWLDPEELRLLFREPGVAGIFARAGIEDPSP